MNNVIQTGSIVQLKSSKSTDIRMTVVRMYGDDVKVAWFDVFGNYLYTNIPTEALNIIKS